MNHISGENENWGWHRANGYQPVINVSGTMTSLGASRAAVPVAQATAAAMGHFVNIHEMQAHASAVIARLTGAEAGCLTASASAGITIAIAGAMTGLSPARVEALPRDPGPRHEVAVQIGHLCGYGAPVSQAVELAGATLRSIGQSTHSADHQLAAALGPQTAAALYVVSHHVVGYGQIPLKRFVQICHAADVPVIVDAASEYDLKGFLAEGADIVIYSGHKFMGGPTSGIIAGRRDLVRASYMQNMGIGRGMKIGKESIAGAIRAMELWIDRDGAAIRAVERRVLDLWTDHLGGIAGVTVTVEPDPTQNPLDRLRVAIDPAVLGVSAAEVAMHLGGLDPAIVVRGHEVEHNYFLLDPCNLAPGQDEMVAAVIAGVLRAPEQVAHVKEAADRMRNGAADSYLSWLAEPADVVSGDASAAGA